MTAVLIVNPLGAETWVGSITGTVSFNFPAAAPEPGCQGSWNIGYQITLHPGGDLVATLLPGSSVISGSASISGSETVGVQCPTNSVIVLSPSSVPTTSLGMFADSPSVDPNFPGVSDIQLSDPAETRQTECWSFGLGPTCLYVYFDLKPTSISPGNISGVLQNFTPDSYYGYSGTFTLTKQ